MNKRLELLLEMDQLLSLYVANPELPRDTQLEMVRLKTDVGEVIRTEAHFPDAGVADEEIKGQAKPLILELQNLIRRPGLASGGTNAKVLEDFTRLYTILGPNDFPDSDPGPGHSKSSSHDSILGPPNRFPDDD